MIKHANGKFDDYSISPKIRQILLHWGYELVKHDLVWFVFCLYKNLLIFINIIINNYIFNRQELLQKAKHKYHNCGGK